MPKPERRFDVLLEKAQQLALARGLRLHGQLAYIVTWRAAISHGRENKDWPGVVEGMRAQLVTQEALATEVLETLERVAPRAMKDDMLAVSALIKATAEFEVHSVAAELAQIEMRLSNASET